MPIPRRLACRLALAAFGPACFGPARFGPARAASPPAPTVIADIDLSRPFATRAPWRLVATQDPPIQDPIGIGGEVPGTVHLCLRRDPSGPCDPQLREVTRPPAKDDPFSDAHELEQARVAFPRGPGHPPLLVMRIASLRSGDGDQVVFTEILAWRGEADRFERVWEHATGRNNNQEVRYIDSGPLAGDIVVAEPTEDAPFGFWVTVHALTPAYGYRQVLRYRSATTYADGNPLAVIDSEMAGIERHLGLWRPGAPLPLPAGPCAHPHLVGMELWCG